MKFFSRNELLVILVAFVAAQTFFNLFSVAGVDFELKERASMDSVNGFDVAAATIVVSALAWGVFRVMAMRGWVAYWPLVASLALAASVAGPLTLAEGETAGVLVGLHVVVAGILTYGFARFGERCALTPQPPLPTLRERGS